MGSSCQACQAENQSILSHTIILKKLRSDKIKINAYGKNKKIIEQEPQMHFQMGPNKQYSGDNHPELKNQGDEDLIFDLSDEFFASTNVQEKNDKENFENSVCQESWSQLTIFSNNRQQLSEPYDHTKVSLTTFFKKNNQSDKHIRTNSIKVSSDNNMNQLDNSKKKQYKKQKQQNEANSQILKKFSYNNIAYYQQENLFQQKLYHSYQIISILKSSRKRRFRSMTPQAKHVRFNLNKLQFQ